MKVLKAFVELKRKKAFLSVNSCKGEACVEHGSLAWNISLRSFFDDSHFVHASKLLCSVKKVFQEKALCFF